jgi:guanine deaminase
MEEYLKLAVLEAQEGLKNNDGGPFGAVITDKDGNIISVTSNRVLELHDATAHAEVMAIRKAGEKLGTHDLSGCILYATGYPCPMCLSAIIWANIKKVYYGTNLKDAEDIGFRDDFIYNYINNKDKDILDLVELSHDECLELFNEYKEKNKEIY